MATALLVWMALEVGTTGYLDTRVTYHRTADTPIAAAATQPRLAELVEANLRLKLRFDPRASVDADVSLFWQWAGLYGDGEARDLPAYRPLQTVSELYASYELTPHLTFTAGKKRVVWGPGLVQNPTDLLNPNKDPTDPAAQRAGAWLLRGEMPYERFTLSLVGAARVLRQYAGLPTSLLVYPGYPTAEAMRGWTADDRDGQAHFALVARAYALVADTDVNVLWAFTNLYNDAFRKKHRAGLTVSHVFGAWEVHGEALFQTGSARPRFDPEEHTPLPPDEDGLRPRTLAGARYLFGDGATASVEHSYDGAGLDAADYRRYLDTLVLARSDERVAAALAGGAAADPGSPQRFVFDPLRRHYLFVSYVRPQIFDDLTAAATLVLSLGDLSGQLNPSLTWSARQWLSLNVAAYVTLPSPGRLGAEIDGARVGELALGASRWRVVGSARAFF